MARRTTKFKYRENDPDIAQRHAESKGDYDRPVSDKFGQFKAKDGKNRIRILPRTWSAEDGPAHWAYPLWIHYEVGPDNAAYPCPKKMGKGDCPMCEEQARLASDGDTEGAKQLRPSLTMLCWVIDRNNEDKGPLIFRMPAKKLEGPICDLSRDEETGERLVIDHPEDGYDITFTRTGTGRTSTDYSAAAIARKPSYLSEDEAEAEEWLALIDKNPLPSCVNEFDYDYLSSIFSGKKSSKRAEEDEEESPPPRSRRSRASETAGEDDEPPVKSKNRRAPTEPEEDDEEDEDDEVPASNSKPRRRLDQEAVDAIDDPDEELDEDEAPEPPARRRRGRNRPPLSRTPWRTPRKPRRWSRSGPAIRRASLSAARGSRAHRWPGRCRCRCQNAARARWPGARAPCSPPRRGPPARRRPRARRPRPRRTSPAAAAGGWS